MVASLIVLGIAFYWWQSKNGSHDTPPVDEETPAPTVSLADGSYVYEGVWDDGGSDPQSCRILFTKDNGRLKSCSYTNLKWSATVQLTGEMRGDSLHFLGKNGKEDLVIALAPGSDGKSLSGRGIDYAHKSGNVKLKLYAMDTASQPSSTTIERVEEPAPVIEESTVSRGSVYSLSGSIDRYNVSMDLNINGSDVTGSYYYRNSGSGARLYLRGTLFSDGEMVLTETNDEGQMTGRFDGTFVSGGTYEGVFSNYRGDTMSFTLFVQ